MKSSADVELRLASLKLVGALLAHMTEFFEDSLAFYQAQSALQVT